MSKLVVMLGRRIRDIRKKTGISQDKLSEMAGISSKYLGEVERGETNATVQILDSIAKALGVETSRLLENAHCGDRELLIKEIHECVKSATDDELKMIHKIIFNIVD